MNPSRRRFIQKSATAACVLPLSNLYSSWPTLASDPTQLDVSVFSKHLQFLDYKQTGQMAAELGFDGVDLTVRPKGHVLPEQVKSKLPQAIKDLEAGGSTCKMITTSIEAITNPYDVDIIKTAAESGVS